MSVSTRTLIEYDWSGVQIPHTGLEPEALQDFSDSLSAARSAVLDDVALLQSGGPVPADWQPLDAGFIELPERILADYREQREASELGRILSAARRLAESVDRVVLLGIGGSYMGARALMEACNHPYHNELNRGQRGGVPRLYFEGNNVDNDAAQGLLDVLGGGPAHHVDDAWGIVCISKSGGTLETAASLRVFLDALRDSCAHDEQLVAERVIPVTGSSGKLFDLSNALGCQEVFAVPNGVGGRFSVLSAVGLLPAAILGLDVVQLLQGAGAMNEHFRTAPPCNNRVLDYVGVCHLMEDRRMATTRVLSVWSKALEATGLWYDQLLAESLGKQERDALPLTVVNTRDLHSRAQQHQEGARDKLFTNLAVENDRTDPIRIGTSELNQDDLNEIADRTYPELMRAALDGTNAAYRDDGRPTASIRLTRADEYNLGQLLQMMMLATAVEGRLIGINPYGQPGVEAYKRHMKNNLGLA